MAKSKTRFTTDLGDSRLIKLLKLESQEKETTMRQVLIQALEGYFAHRLETKALAKASEAIFKEWNDPRDSEYDKL
ncbi:MAG: hypothetical protein HYY61_02385 [Deltaproteobacteria bacterium]|nr:hypothetical protein [Deltaproteobacteria bacterium]